MLFSSSRALPHSSIDIPFADPRTQNTIVCLFPHLFFSHICILFLVLPIPDRCFTEAIPNPYSWHDPIPFNDPAVRPFVSVHQFFMWIAQVTLLLAMWVAICLYTLVL